ncbi:hypothetical protein [Arthrobacter psychrolactophilus]
MIGLIIIGVSASLAGIFLMWFNPPTRTGQKGSFIDVSEPEVHALDLVEDQPAPDLRGKNVLQRWVVTTRHNIRWVNIASWRFWPHPWVPVWFLQASMWAWWP